MIGPDYIVDIDGIAESSTDANNDKAVTGRRSFRGRPWLAVHWRCCGRYTRIYRNYEGTSYIGICPACGMPVQIRIEPGGTKARFFWAQ